MTLAIATLAAPSQGKCVHIGRSSTTLTMQTAVEFETGPFPNYNAIAAFDSTNAAICFQDYSDSKKGKCVHIGRSSTTLTMQTAVDFESGTTNYIAVAAFDGDNAYVGFQDSDDSSKGKGLLLQRTTDSSGGTVGDPHLTFAYGGKADFRGIHDTAFNFLSVPSLSINVRTVERTFVRWGMGAVMKAPALIHGVYAQPLGQVVHGSFINAVYIRARSNMTGADVLVAILAEQTRSFRLYPHNQNSATSVQCALELHSNVSVVFLPPRATRATLASPLVALCQAALCTSTRHNPPLLAVPHLWQPSVLSSCRCARRFLHQPHLHRVWRRVHRAGVGAEGSSARCRLGGVVLTPHDPQAFDQRRSRA